MIEAAAAGAVVVGGADARGLTPLPQFEVLGPVVTADAVLVVDILARFEEPAECSLHDEPMLGDVSVTRRCSRMIWRIHEDVAGRVNGATAFPSRRCRTTASSGSTPVTLQLRHRMAPENPTLSIRECSGWRWLAASALTRPRRNLVGARRVRNAMRLPGLRVSPRRMAGEKTNRLFPVTVRRLRLDRAAASALAWDRRSVHGPQFITLNMGGGSDACF